MEFIPHDSADEEPFGFIDPATVIRGCHLIPDFNLGRTRELMPASLFQDDAGDWKRFCVAQFVNFIFYHFRASQVYFSVFPTAI